MVESVVEELGNRNRVMHFFDLPLVEGFDVGGLLAEPAKVVCDQVHLLAPSTPHQDHSFRVGVLREGTDRPSVTFVAGKMQHIQVVLWVLDPFHLVQDRQCSVCSDDLHFFFAHFGLLNPDHPTGRNEIYISFLLYKIIDRPVQKGTIKDRSRRVIPH